MFARFAGAFLVATILLSGHAAPASAQEGYASTADGARLFYRRVGEGGPVVVMVHGGPGNSLESIAPDLKPLEQGRTLIYYDQRGGGRSTLVRERARLTLQRHVEDLETLRKHFGLEKLTLLGNSWGGLLVGAYIAAHPERVERAVLHDPAPPTMAMLRRMNPSINRRLGRARAEELTPLWDPETWMDADDPHAYCRDFYARLLPAYFSDPSRVRRMRGDVCAGSPDAVRGQQLVNGLIWSSMLDYDLRPALRAAQAPVLVIHGRQDPAPLEGSRAWADALPNGRLLVIADAGHLPHVEQPEVFFPAVDAFLRAEPPPTGRSR